jgi:hypothetical protein
VIRFLSDNEGDTGALMDVLEQIHTLFLLFLLVVVVLVVVVVYVRLYDQTTAYGSLPVGYRYRNSDRC